MEPEDLEKENLQSVEDRVGRMFTSAKVELEGLGLLRGFR